MSAMSSDAKQLLMLEAERLGYGRPVMTKGGHLLWIHSSTGQRVITGARLAGRALYNARAQLKRSAIGGKAHCTIISKRTKISDSQGGWV